jgi:hypothetical protein
MANSVTERIGNGQQCSKVVIKKSQRNLWIGPHDFPIALLVDD